ncbi:hypothetical protein GQ42DRAFT_161322 [Ramicandelaber brevisporus]|nr:hypothetical protein GQ42DRAFT_161322 [Ramicandelaber brevisporus]
MRITLISLLLATAATSVSAGFDFGNIFGGGKGDAAARTHANPRAADAPAIESEYRVVAIGSTLRLTHRATGYKLHSPSISYGGGRGSGQNAVVAAPPSAVSAEASWSLLPKIMSGSGKFDVRPGQPVHCGMEIVLLHNDNGRALHSHAEYESPLSGQQEVSGYDGRDSGDVWIVECFGPNASQADSSREPPCYSSTNGLSDEKLLESWWLREYGIRLRHAVTGKYLSASSKHTFGQPIQGWVEVSAVSGSDLGANDDAVWVAQEGTYTMALADAKCAPLTSKESTPKHDEL